MSILVTDEGFAPAPTQVFTPLGELAANQSAAHIAMTTADNVEELRRHFDGLKAVRIDVDSFADGRGFTLAQRLRHMGFTGHIRAKGHLIADQYAMARRAGIDAIEISDEMAARQPEDQWLFRSDWAAHDYQSRLGRTA